MTIAISVFDALLDRPVALTVRCALTGWSAVNERNGERRGRKAPQKGPTARERPEKALSRRPGRFARICKPLRILALERATQGALALGVSR